MLELPLTYCTCSQPAPGGPGLCFPGPLYLFPPLCDSLLHSKELWSILFLLPLALLIQIFSLCPWLFLGKGRGSWEMRISSLFLMLALEHLGQQKITVLSGKPRPC